MPYYCTKREEVIDRRKAYKYCLVSRKNWKSGKETYCQSLRIITKERKDGKKID